MSNKPRKITKSKNFKISGQKNNAEQSKILRYFFLDENLILLIIILDIIKLKLNRASCLLSKIRYFVRAPLLRTI